MESIFGWIGQVVEWVGSLIPRWYIVNSTHEGVAFIRGKKIKRIKAGMFFYWPIWTEIMTYPVVRQSVNLPNQTLSTIDDYTVSISAVIIYTVSDIRKALAEQWDLNETISDLSMSAVKQVVCASHYEDLIINWSEIDDNLKERLSQIMVEYGINILEARVTDLAQTKCITIVNGGQVGYIPEEE
jgi:regulator of protease activity HflC (stomatin/prohibitin superfamily)